PAAAAAPHSGHRRDVPHPPGVRPVRPALRPHRRRAGHLHRVAGRARLACDVPGHEVRAGRRHRHQHRRTRAGRLPALPEGLPLPGRPRGGRMNPRTTPGVRRWLNGTNLAALLVALFVAAPLYWLTATSFKTTRDVGAASPSLVPSSP